MVQTVNLRLSLRTPQKQQSSSSTLTTSSTVIPPKTLYEVTFNGNQTVAELKNYISLNFDGKPSLDGIILVLGGRVLNGSDVLEEVLKDVKGEIISDNTINDKDKTSETYEIHVMIKNSAWTVSSTPSTITVTPIISALPASSPVVATTTLTPTPTIPLPLPNPTTPVRTPLSARRPKPGYRVEYMVPEPIYDPSLPTDTSTSSSAPISATTTNTSTKTPTISNSTTSGYPTYLAYVSQLIPLQRSLLVLNLQKAHYFYSLEIQDRLIKLGWGEPLNRDNVTGHKVEAKIELEKVEGETEEEFEERKLSEKVRLEKDFEAGLGEVKEIRDLLMECGLWTLVEEKEKEAEIETKNWNLGIGQVGQEGEFQVVQISGLPYILHMPNNQLESTHSAPPSLPHYKSLKRGQAILHILTTMLQLLITYQPSAPSVAYGRAPLRSHASTTAIANGQTGAAGAGLGVHFDDVPGRRVAVEVPALVPGVGGIAAVPVVPRRRATLSIVINLEAIISILVPLILLALKLGFLLWIFGRHASKTKRYILFGLAGVWILWEAWTLLRRRSAGTRERERERRRLANLAAGIPDLQPAGVPAAARRGGEDPVRAHRAGRAPRGGIPPLAGGIVDPAAVVPRVRAIASRLTPRYWLNYIAAVGLAEEARELGLVPRSIAGRPVTNPSPQYQPVAPNDRIGLARQARRRAFRTAMIAIVLFFGTLSPEVERKRKRALDKRDKLLALRQVNRMKKALAAAAVKAQEDADKEREKKEHISTSSSSTTTTSTIEPSSLVGRQVISDSNLFVDGQGEPDQDAAHDSGSGSGVEGGTETERMHNLAVIEGRVEEDSDEELERMAERDREERERDEVPLF